MLGGYCTTYGNISLVAYADILPKLTNDYIESLQVVEYNDINETKIWSNSILLSKDFYEAGRRTTVGDVRLLGALLAIGIANRFATFILQSRRGQSEGPYGGNAPIHNYENGIFIAGGTGISGALPYLQDYLSSISSPQNNSSASLNTRTQHITLVWASKNSAMIRDIAGRELREVLLGEGVHAAFYAISRHESATSIGRKNTESSSDSSGGVEITYGRPNVKVNVSSVIDEVSAAGSAGGEIAVLVCGPAGMADDARKAVHQALKGGRRGVAYFEETFGW